MRLILNETPVRAGMTLAAGGNKVRLSHWRSGVRCWSYIVGLVAVPTARRLNVATEGSQLRVKGISIRTELIFVTRSANRRRLHTECRGSGRLNRMCGVAI